MTELAKTIENIGKEEFMLMSIVSAKPDSPTGNPVIYLYPTAPTDVSVKLGYPSDNLTYTYPEYNGGWNVAAYPDGRIVDKPDKSEHWYLFWEGDKKLNWNFDEGFVVKGSDTEHFLREKLAPLYVSPAPDTTLRVNMVYKPCGADAKIKPQKLSFTERRGFTVVEWGGTRA